MLGAGDIGSRVAEVLRALDVGVTLAARRPRDGLVGLDEARALLPEVDALVVTLPLTPSTTGLVNARVLAALPDGAIVINVARGAIAETEALTEEVGSGRLRAGLDVTEPEPLPADHPLWTLPGALITPHVGGGAEGLLSRGVALVRAQLHRLHDGNPLENVVSDGSP